MHAALGEPARLAIVDDLAVSDRSPKELGERHGLPTNLLAHHLDVSGSGGTDRPVRLGGRSPTKVRASRPCTVDAARQRRSATRTASCCSCAATTRPARSWQRHCGRHAPVSPPSRPVRTPPHGCTAARWPQRAGRVLTSRGAVPRRVDEIDPDTQVVTVCDRAHEELEPAPTWWHWSIPDPVETGTAAAFDAVVADLDARIRTIRPVA